MKDALTAIAIVVLLHVGAGASSAADRVTGIGYGANTCAAFVSVKPGSPEEGVYLAWLGGFMSGTNVWNAFTREDLLEGVDMPALKVWMQNYCRDKPLETFLSAAKALGQELIERRKPSGR